MNLLWLSLACVFASGHTPLPDHWCSADNAFCLEYAITATHFAATMTGRTRGFLALGFPDRPAQMGPADVIVGRVAEGVARLTDHSTTADHRLLGEDAQQDYELLAGSQLDGVTSISFRRLLNTRDAADQRLDQGVVPIIWAISDAPSFTGHETFGSGTLAAPVPKWLVQDVSGSSNSSITGKYSSGDFSLSWSIQQNTTIQFTMSAQTTGYVSIGFSDRADKMGPGDAYAGWVDGSGQVYVADFSTNGDWTINDLDVQQDAANVTGSRAGGQLAVSFARRLDTKDSQDRAIASGSTNVVFCWSPIIPTLLGNRKMNIQQHTIRGSTTINFFSSSSGSSPAPAVTGSVYRTFQFCNGVFCLAWYLGTDSIGFQMNIQATGYVAIGLSDSAGSMGPADAYAGWLDSTGAVYVIDFTTNKRDINPPDTIQNVANISGSSSGGTLSVTFYRPLNTNDAQDKVITQGTMHLIWCWSNSVPYGSSIPEHASSDVGSAEVNFFTGEVSISNDLQLWIPVASVAAFVATLLLPGLLGKLFGPSFTGRVDRFLGFHPFPPRQRTWYDALTLDLLYAMRDMQVGDFFIVVLWLAAVLLMLLSPTGNPLGRVCAAAFGTLLLPVTRYSVWAAWLGSSFERYLKFHRWASRATLIIIIAHLIVQLLDKGSDVLTANDDDSGFGWVFGLISFIVMAVMSLFAMDPVRRRFFELFYYTHFLAFPAVALAMMHSYAVCYAMIPSLVMYLTDKVLQFWSLAHKYRILKATPLAGAVRLVVESPHKKFFRCAPGQYYFVTIPAVSHLQAHPFSVAVISADSSDITFVIRNMGPWTFTNKVANLTSSGTPSFVRLSGPHGSLSLPRPLVEYAVIYLIAGGVGVTPMISIAQTLLRVAPGQLKVHFIWVSRDAVAFNDWFPTILVQMLTSQSFEVHLFDTSESHEKDKGPAVELLVRNGVYAKPVDDSPAPPTSPPHSVTDVDVTRLGPSIVGGRPDWNALFAPHSMGGQDVAVLACGPAPLMADVQRAAYAARFHFHKETFAL